ncbi:hypothetical protein Hdeb2414_s0002g00057281 [Helianthus debilis subsp. tardiflorus]
MFTFSLFVSILNSHTQKKSKPINLAFHLLDYYLHLSKRTPSSQTNHQKNHMEEPATADGGPTKQIGGSAAESGGGGSIIAAEKRQPPPPPSAMIDRWSPQPTAGRFVYPAVTTNSPAKTTPPLLRIPVSNTLGRRRFTAVFAFDRLVPR